jgi:hypothetical protein
MWVAHHCFKIDVGISKEDSHHHTRRDYLPPDFCFDRVSVHTISGRDLSCYPYIPSKPDPTLRMSVPGRPKVKLNEKETVFSLDRQSFFGVLHVWHTHCHTTHPPTDEHPSLGVFYFYGLLSDKRRKYIWHIKISHTTRWGEISTLTLTKSMYTLVSMVGHLSPGWIHTSMVVSSISFSLSSRPFLSSLIISSLWSKPWRESSA